MSEIIWKQTVRDQQGEKMRMLSQLTMVSAITLTMSCTAALAQKKYDTGATDTEIKIGQTLPFSGPVSAVSTIGKAQVAYMQMINDRGGVNGRKINLIQYDDSYSPPKTVEQVRKLVESDEVLLTFQLIGTPGNAAVQKYLNQKRIPQLLAGTGSERVNDPLNYPWTIGFNLSFQTEGKAYAQYIQSNYPNAKIGVLYQNDDLGRDYLAGLKAGLGDKASTMIVAQASYEVTDPTIDSQLAKLRDSGANLFYNASTAKFAAQAIKKLAAMGWQPVHILNNTANTISEVLRPAGLENSKGIVSIRYAKDQNDPEWKDDPGMNRFLAFMEKYYPSGDKLSILNAYGYSTSELLVEILARCGDDLTRENVMKQATSLNNVVLDLALPGIVISSSPTDYHLNKQMQMAKFDGERWQLFGPIISAGEDGK
jgi:ABC-type branched-subunit amino acid transport system substrate-binding protein